MSIVGIFSRARPEIGGTVFDAILEESTELRTDATEYPIESGVSGHDHAVLRPLQITMRVGISNNAFRAAGLLSNAAGVGIGQSLDKATATIAAAAGLAGSVANAAFAAGQARTRSANALEQIREIQKRSELIEIVTSNRKYDRCIITNTRQQTTKENEGGLELVIEMKQLLVVSSTKDEGNTPAPNDSATTQAQTALDLGLVTMQ